MDNFNRHFGLVIAYLLPGFVALAGIAPFVPIVAGWLVANQTTSFGAPLYALLAATAAGMTVSCIRWALVDQIHALTGLGAPAFNARALEERPAAFTYLVESHYRYYQFYANTLVAVAWSYSIHRWLRTSSLLRFGTDLGVLLLCAVLFAGSRDALAKYRTRINELKGQVSLIHSDGEPMTNGIDHNQGGASTPKPSASQSARKPSTKPKAAHDKPPKTTATQSAK
jgi:hypothetical protein